MVIRINGWGMVASVRIDSRNLTAKIALLLMELRTLWTPNLSELLDQLESTAAKELVQSVGSAPLMTNQSKETNFHWGESKHEEILASLCESEAIHRITTWGIQNGPFTTSGRLGHRFERLVEAWFTLHPDWTVHTANAVIQGQDRTLGELDLLLERNDEWIHLELACKFYLGVGHSKRWDQWVGIDPTDRLDLKLKTFQRQVQLSEIPEADQWLANRGWRVDNQRCWLKGWFFHHFSNIHHPTPPRFAALNYPSGWWSHARDWNIIWSNAEQWIALQPEHWLRTRHPSDDIHLLESPSAINKLWHLGRSGIMVCLASWNGQEWVETSRGIVVPDTWPVIV
jgi:uncharacterized protein